MRTKADALKALGACRPDVVVLDAEVGNSTFSEKFQQAHPDRFFEMFIAEQEMIGAAVGFSTRRKRPFASTFACFLTRDYDFIRRGAISPLPWRFAGRMPEFPLARMDLRKWRWKIWL